MSAFEILTKHHDRIQRNGEKPGEYDEDSILAAMEEYAKYQWQNGYDAGFNRAVSIFDESFQILTSKKK